MIRLATMNDADACIRLAVDFFTPFLTQHNIPVIVDDVKKIAVNSIEAQKVFVIDHNEVQGIAAWEIIRHPANYNVKIFYETIWCVKSKYKTDVLLLMRALEKEAKKAKVSVMLMANLNDKREEQLRRIFFKRGFSFLESHYAKKIGE